MTDEWKDELVKDEECASCRLPLPSARKVLMRVEGKPVCSACYDMRDAIADNQYMQRQQQQFEEDIKKLGRLKPGGEYFG